VYNQDENIYIFNSNLEIEVEMNSYTKTQLQENQKYLELLSQSFPNITSAVGEVVNLKAILNLPKGTEHFLTDIHGEHEAFNHVMQMLLVPSNARSTRNWGTP